MHFFIALEGNLGAIIQQGAMGTALGFSAFLAVLIGMVILLIICEIVYIVYNAKRSDPLQGPVEETEVIWVEDSPQPTKSKPTPKSRMRRLPVPAIRGGNRRLCGHVRKVTLWYNPSQRNHCAYACALRLAGKRITKVSISTLRKMTSEIIVDAYNKKENKGNLNVFDVVTESGVQIGDYAKQIRKNQWASPAELSAALEALECAAYLHIGKQRQVIGQGQPQHTIRLCDHHYVLQRGHACAYKMSASERTCLHRGGMRLGTTPLEQQEEIPDWAMQPARMPSEATLYPSMIQRTLVPGIPSATSQSEAQIASEATLYLSMTQRISTPLTQPTTPQRQTPTPLRTIPCVQSTRVSQVGTASSAQNQSPAYVVVNPHSVVGKKEQSTQTLETQFKAQTTTQR